MAGYVSDDNSILDTQKKTVLVPPHERISREELGDHISDAGDVWDPNVPLYVRVPLDDPRPAVDQDPSLEHAAHAVG